MDQQHKQEKTRRNGRNPEYHEKPLTSASGGCGREEELMKQEAKKRAKELAKKEEELDYEPKGSGFSVFLVALLLVLIWLGIAALVIKMDIGGVGTNIAAPILKDIPVVKYILPKDAITETTDVESYYGYTSNCPNEEQGSFYIPVE
jgi:hypothetical protein